MSKKRGRSKKQPVQVQAIPEEFLAEGSGPHDDIEAISGIQPAELGSEDLEVTAIGQDETLAGQVDGELAADADGAVDAEDDGDELKADSDGIGAELSADGDGAELPADVDGAELSADADGDADGAELSADGDGDELSAVGEGDGVGDGLGVGDGVGSRLSADGDDELSAGHDGAELSGDGAELLADGDGGEIEVGDGEAAAMPTSAASMDAGQLKQLVEALVFASDKPITVQRLRQLTRVSDVPRLEQTLVEIAADYAERGLVLQQVSGGYQFRTRPQFSAWVQQLIAGRPVRLSRAQLETLAIIAYRQPITRPEIDDIRGVDSSATLKLLMDRLLIRVLGKKEEVGRPMLYGTTREFLDFFSLGDLRELPTLREYSELSDESRKVMSSRLGIGMDGDGSDGGGDDSGGSDGGGSDDGGDSGGGGSSGSGGSFGGGGGGGADDLGDLGDPAHLDQQDGSGDHDDLSARSLSDLAAKVLANDDADADVDADDDADVTNQLSALEPDAAHDETLTVDAATRKVLPIVVEEVDLDAETRDLDPVTETMTLADAPDLERSETRIVDPLIAAEVLAHAETIVSSGESPE